LSAGTGLILRGKRQKKHWGNPMKRAATILAASCCCHRCCCRCPRQPTRRNSRRINPGARGPQARKRRGDQDFAISYGATHANAKKSNAILMVTAISCNHHRLDFMIARQGARHRQNHFIVCTMRSARVTTSRVIRRRSRACSITRQIHTIRHNVAIGSPHWMKEKLASISRRGGRPVDGRHAGAAMGVSHPDYMDALVAMVAARQDAGLVDRGDGIVTQGHYARSCMEGRHYDAPPEKGIRLCATSSRSCRRDADMYAAQFKNGKEILPCWSSRRRRS
jgi:homoserine O-acetyltransferase